MIPAVTISNINKNFGALQALKDINFNIDQNTYFGLLGPNGAGKSTLINIMAGLSRATRGSIDIMGYNVRSKWKKARQSIGVVPQELIYDSFFTVREINQRRYKSSAKVEISGGPKWFDIVKLGLILL